MNKEGRQSDKKEGELTWKAGEGERKRERRVSKREWEHSETEER